MVSHGQVSSPGHRHQTVRGRLTTTLTGDVTTLSCLFPCGVVTSIVQEDQNWL